MPKIDVYTEKLGEVHGPYAQAMRAGDFLFESQIGTKPDGEYISDSVYDQTLQILENYKVTLEELGYGLDSIVKTTIYLTDWNDFDAMNKAWKEVMKKPYPARATVKVAGLCEGARVEMEIIAYLA